MPSPASQPTTFTLFPHLPSELRLKIWQHACLPRTLALTYSTTTNSFTTNSNPPILLSISHEARKEGLRVYTLSFGTRTSSPQIYFNPYLDTLYFPRQGEMGYDEALRDFRNLAVDPRKLLDEVRVVAVDHVSLDIKRPWESYNKATLIRGFKRLKDVILVLPSSERNVLGGSVTGELKLVDPKETPEMQLKIWYCFRQSFAIEEKVLEEVCAEVGREYERYMLPTIRIRSKAVINSNKRLEAL